MRARCGCVPRLNNYETQYFKRCLYPWIAMMMSQ